MPFAFTHGPFPMRLRPSVGRLPLSASRSTLRYARQVFEPAPAAVARFWHRASAPRRPPRFPVTLVALVTKKPSVADGAGVGFIVELLQAAAAISARSAAAAYLEIMRASYEARVSHTLSADEYRPVHQQTCT